jgi:putative addiction module killer protein
MNPVKVSKTSEFDKWLRKLKDLRAQVTINAHIDRMSGGDFGKTRHVGTGVWEKKINYGLGYRLYYCQIGETWILLLCGGDKSTQQTDIKQAKDIKKGLQ